MEIEYRNKCVVTWCLDRDGPQICLRAIARENKLRTIEIVSKDFSLEFEEEEARAFLNILSQLAGTGLTKPVIKYPETEISKISEQKALGSILESMKSEISETASEIVEPETIEAIPAELEVSEPSPDYGKPEVPVSVSTFTEVETPSSSLEIKEELIPQDPDSSEIIQILKQSEHTYSEVTPSSPNEDFMDKQATIPHIAKDSKIQEKSIISKLTRIQEQTEDLEPDIETASFFRKSITKSPLEMLLEEDKTTEESFSEDIQGEEPQKTYPQTKPAYKPEDLHTEAFFSKFDTKLSRDLQPKPEFQPEPKTRTEPEFKHAVQLKPTPTLAKKEPPKTDVERRAAIEKERAERRRRLWELTRGF
ncbi:MAG: hypothetical protein ACFFBQ_09540 [Promethearchaeota archaeon]